MTATILHLPQTAAGRALLRDCLSSLRDWRWPNGDPVEEGEFDEAAAAIENAPPLGPEDQASLDEFLREEAERRAR